MEKYTLVHADSRAHISGIASGSIDLILTDPPYNLNPYSTGNINLSWRRDINNDLAKWDGEVFDPGEWLGEFRRVLKPGGNIFAFTSYNRGYTRQIRKSVLYLIVELRAG